MIRKLFGVLLVTLPITLSGIESYSKGELLNYIVNLGCSISLFMVVLYGLYLLTKE